MTTRREALGLIGWALPACDVCGAWTATAALLDCRGGGSFNQDHRECMDPDVGWLAPCGAIVFAAHNQPGAHGRGPRIPSLPQARCLSLPRRRRRPLSGKGGHCAAACRYSRDGRVRRRHDRRIYAHRAGRCTGGDRVDRSPALVQRKCRHARDLLWLIHRTPGSGQGPPCIEGDRLDVWNRAALSGRHSLSGWLPHQ